MISAKMSDTEFEEFLQQVYIIYNIKMSSNHCCFIYSRVYLLLHPVPLCSQGLAMLQVAQSSVCPQSMVCLCGNVFCLFTS